MNTSFRKECWEITFVIICIYMRKELRWNTPFLLFFFNFKTCQTEIMNKDNILDCTFFLPGPNMNLCYSIYVLASKFVLPFSHSDFQFLFYNFEFLVSSLPTTWSILTFCGLKQGTKQTGNWEEMWMVCNRSFLYSVLLFGSHPDHIRNLALEQ